MYLIIICCKMSCVICNKTVDDLQHVRCAVCCVIYHVGIVNRILDKKCCSTKCVVNTICTVCANNDMLTICSGYVHEIYKLNFTHLSGNNSYCTIRNGSGVLRLVLKDIILQSDGLYINQPTVIINIHKKALIRNKTILVEKQLSESVPQQYIHLKPQYNHLISTYTVDEIVSYVRYHIENCVLTDDIKKKYTETFTNYVNSLTLHETLSVLVINNPNYIKLKENICSDYEYQLDLLIANAYQLQNYRQMICNYVSQKYLNHRKTKWFQNEPWYLKYTENWQNMVDTYFS